MSPYPELALVVAGLGFLALLIHLVLHAGSEAWEKAPRMPLEDDQILTPRTSGERSS